MDDLVKFHQDSPNKVWSFWNPLYSNYPANWLVNHQYGAVEQLFDNLDIIGYTPNN